jgi:hypothetical protein
MMPSAARVCSQQKQVPDPMKGLLAASGACGPGMPIAAGTCRAVPCR